MVMSTKKIVRGIDKSLNEAVSEINASTPKPDMKDDGAELKAAVAPKNDLSFAEAFKANRMAGNKTFTWKGKSYNTKMAGEGASRPATTTASRRSGTGSSTTSRPATTPTVSTPSAPPTPTRAQIEAKRTAARAQEAVREKRAENQADFRKRMQERREPALIMVGDAARRESARKRAEIIARGERPGASTWEKSQAKFYRENPTAMKKGGSVDGCAVRGKTRAMKKGK